MGQIDGFADSNAVWSVSGQKFFIQGDSLFNNFTYKKIFVENNDIITSGSFYALIREDIVESKVYAIHKDSTVEHLLYDFSLSEGDQATVHPLSEEVYIGPVDIIVDVEDSIIINGAYRKRLKISGVNQNTGMQENWIAGIGSTFGLFGSGLTGVIVFDAIYPVLLCYEANDTLLYDNPNYSSCYEPHSGIDKFIESSKITAHVFPNPSADYIQIISDTEIINYKIYNSLGENVRRVNKMKNAEIDISYLPVGVYNIKLVSNSGIIIVKFIKIN